MNYARVNEIVIRGGICLTVREEAALRQIAARIPDDLTDGDVRRIVNRCGSRSPEWAQDFRGWLDEVMGTTYRLGR